MRARPVVGLTPDQRIDIEAQIQRLERKNETNGVGKLR